MKKIQIINFIIISIILVISIIFLIAVGFGELYATIKYHHDDFLFMGLPQLIAAITSIIYLILAIKVYKSNKITPLIKKAYWTNIIGLIIFLGCLLILLIISLFYINSSLPEALLGIVLLGYFATFIWIFIFIISFIIFIIGYLKAK